MEKIMVLANDTTYVCSTRDILLKRLVSEGYEVVVVCGKLKKVNELMSTGVRFIDIRINRHTKNPFSDLSLFNKFRRIGKCFNAHTHGKIPCLGTILEIKHLYKER